MKKLLVVLLTIAMVMAFSACGGGDDGTSDESADGGKFSKYKSAEYLDAMNSGTYYLDATAYTMGFETTMKQAVDGKNSDTIGEAMGIASHSMVLDGKTYQIDDENKTYSIIDIDEDMEDATEDIADEPAGEVEDLEFVEEGKSVIEALGDKDTNEYEYEEFAVKDDDGEFEVTVRCFIKDGKVYAVETALDDMNITMIINKITTKIPDDMLKIPDGYEEVDSVS